MLRTTARRTSSFAPTTSLAPPAILRPSLARSLHNTPPGRDGKPGSYSRTDSDVVVEYPEEHELPSSKPVHGTGGQYVKPTLASFSLNGNVGLVTGGARGLGLVIGQGMVYSGSDLALVDMNSESCPSQMPTSPIADMHPEEEAEKQTKLLVDAFVRENPNAERYVVPLFSLARNPRSCGIRSIPKVTAHYADVSDPESVEACIAEVIEQHGKIDNLVTSAGFTENFEAIHYPIDRLRKLWAVNVDGTYLFATSVARHLMARKASGSMVMIGSMSGSIVNVPQPQA